MFREIKMELEENETLINSKDYYKVYKIIGTKNTLLAMDYKNINPVIEEKCNIENCTRAYQAIKFLTVGETQIVTEWDLM